MADKLFTQEELDNHISARLLKEKAKLTTLEDKLNSLKPLIEKEALAAEATKIKNEDKLKLLQNYSLEDIDKMLKVENDEKAKQKLVKIKTKTIETGQETEDKFPTV